MIKKILACLVALCSTVSVCSAAEYMGIQNTSSQNIYIEGKLDNYTSGNITLRLYDSGGIRYINEITPNQDGAYVLKFKFGEDASKLSYDLKYNGEDVNTSVITAYSDTSSLINADLYLMDGEGGGLRIDGDTSRMTYTDFDKQTYVPEGETATPHTYEVTDLADYISADTEVGVAVYPKNELGNDGVGYTVMLAQYDANNRLISCKTLASNTMTYYDYSGKMIDCGKIALEDGVKTVKAFMWDSKNNLVPYTKAANGALTPTNLYLVGDSTYQGWNFDWMSVFPQAGVGSFVGDYFNSDYITVYNKAVSGATAESWLDDDAGLGNWPALKPQLKKGDYVLFALGLNDLWGNGSASKKAEFKGNMEIMIKDVLATGATPILASPILIVQDDNAVSGGVGFLNVVLEALEELGTTYDLEVLPVHEAARKIYEERGWTAQDAADKYHLTEAGVKAIIGEERYNNYYKNGKRGAFGDDPNNFDLADDKGHLNVYGADFYANLLSELIAQTESPLKFYLK